MSGRAQHGCHAHHARDDTDCSAGARRAVPSVVHACLYVVVHLSLFVLVFLSSDTTKEHIK